VEQTILRSEVMKIADSGELFDMTFITADRRRGTGGEIIEVSNWQKMDNDAPVERMPGRFRKTVRAMAKNPNHWIHKTINIFNPGNKMIHPYKVHFRLIQFFNGKRVLNG
jgi:hypothetical protein